LLTDPPGQSRVRIVDRDWLGIAQLGHIATGEVLGDLAGV
jgi:hypothetical protein